MAPEPDGLSASQRVAVAHRHGRLLVLGLPGTGKTETLARRVARSLDEGAPAPEMVALAPSVSAARQLRKRLERVAGPASDEVEVLTGEALCRRLLESEALEAGLDPFFPTLSRADRLALLLEHVDDLVLRRHEIRGNPAGTLARLLERVDALKRRLVTPAAYREWAERRARQASGPEAIGTSEELEFAQFFADHDSLVQRTGALDAGDLGLHAVRLLERHPLARARLATRFRHLFADDVHALAPAHGAVLRGLARDGEHLFACADPGGGGVAAAWGRPSELELLEAELPDVVVQRLPRAFRSRARILAGAHAVSGSLAPPTRARSGGSVRFWRCSSERAQAQAVAGEAAALVRRGVAPAAIGVLVRSVEDEAAAVREALAERGVPAVVEGAGVGLRRAEVRDVLAWLRLLSDPGDSGAVVRALARPPVELASVDIARLTQLARRRKLDMVTAAATACEGPQLSPEGRERVGAFLRLHATTTTAFEDLRPDAFVPRLIERLGLRPGPLVAVESEALERLGDVARLAELAARYARREPRAGSRDFARYLVAVAEAGLDDDETASSAGDSVAVLGMEAAEGREFAHAFVLGLSAARMPGPPGAAAAAAPAPGGDEGAAPEAGAGAHLAAMRRLLEVAMTRAADGLVLSWTETAQPGAPARPSPFVEEARAALEGEEEIIAEQLISPAEGLEATFRTLRDELLAGVAEVGGKLGEMRLDTYLDVSGAVVRYLELLKVAALIERAKAGEEVEDALPEVNDLLLQAAMPDQRELFRASGLDDALREAARGIAPRARIAADPALDTFIPRRGDGLMLSASDVETYRLCPLKYKFSRVFRIPQEPTINQRFGILLHQVLERFHASGGGSLEYLMHLFYAGWRRAGFGDANDDLQFRRRAVSALRRYWERDREREGEPVWFERSFSFPLGPHLVRGRVDRVDRLPDGGYELIDYKTGRPRSAKDLQEDVQLSLYGIAARRSWGVEASAQSYYYVLDDEKVPVAHSEREYERVSGTVAEIAEGILGHSFEPRPAPDLCGACDYRIVCPAAER